MLINKQVINVVKFYAYGAELAITLTISSVAMVCNRRATLLQILSLSIPKDLSSVFNRENFCRSSWTFWLFSLASLVFSPNENPPNLEKTQSRRTVYSVFFVSKYTMYHQNNCSCFQFPKKLCICFKDKYSALSETHCRSSICLLIMGPPFQLF